MKVDDSQFQQGVKKILQNLATNTRKAVLDVSYETLRLSQREVPHDKGELQNSGQVQLQMDGSALVGYNKVYAARLHEHPEYVFQKGRKGHYLSDPIRNNIAKFRQYFAGVLR